MRSPKEIKDAFEGVYKRGIAIGHSDIRKDEMTFRFRNEVFTFPTIDVIPISIYTGYFYEAKVDALRKLSKVKH